MPLVTWTDYRAVLFDLDGVVTPTAVVHMAAWADLFNGFLTGPEVEQVAPDLGPDGRAPYTDEDYFRFVDGKPRYDGVRDFLASRGITVPEGTPQDPPTALTVCGLGNRKNDAFNAVLERDGVEPYPGSVRLIDHLGSLGIPLAVVSSSVNAPHVLAVTGLADRFTTVVDGKVAADLGLAGKPAPDTFAHAAEVLGAPVSASVVLEDAVSGVRAGAAGGFGLVIGVDRGAGAGVLQDAGADIVVADLAELIS